MRTSIKIAVSLIIFINILHGQTNTLTYAAYMETIRDQIPELKINAVVETNAEMNLLSAKSSADVNLSAQLGAVGKYGSLSSSTSTSVGPTAEAAGIQASIGVGSLIPYSGTRWSVNLTHNSFIGGKLYYPGNPQPIDFNNYQPSLTIQVTQPLLRNFFGTLDKYPIRDAEYALNIAKLQRRLDDASVVVAYQKIYYQWIMFEKLLEYYRSMYITGRSFENQMRNRYNNGLIDNDSYQSARKQTMVYSDYYAQNQVNLETLLATISFFMPVTNIKPDHTTWDAYLDLGSNMQMEAVNFSDSINGQIAYQSKIRAEYTLETMKNGTMPNLDLVGNVNLNGLSPNSDGYFKSFGSMTNVDFFAGVQFSYPIGNRANKAQYKMAENSLYGIIAQYDQLEKDYNTQLQTYISRFNAYKNLISSKQMQIRAINSRIATQLQKLDQGRLEIDDLLTSRLDLVATQTELLNLQYEFITTIFDYRALLAIDYE